MPLLKMCIASNYVTVKHYVYWNVCLPLYTRLLWRAFLVNPKFLAFTESVEGSLGSLDSPMPQTQPATDLDKGWRRLCKLQTRGNCPFPFQTSVDRMPTRNTLPNPLMLTSLRRAQQCPTHMGANSTPWSCMTNSPPQIPHQTSARSRLQSVTTCLLPNPRKHRRIE